jgi:O-antigen/teichoic acid export membrane protein
VYIFGVYALATSIIQLSIVLPNFGMGGAFLHRTTETKDIQVTAAVHFTIKTILISIWALLLITCALIFTKDEIRIALIFLTITHAGLALAQTPKIILIRRVHHRRLAIIQLLNSVLTTVVALGLSWQGATLWALLAMDFVTLTITITALYLWRPVWRPRFLWSTPIVRYLIHFGYKNLISETLSKAQDRFDDLWTSYYLGVTPLGFYSRAYTFATYPRKILATPINSVAGGTFAELKNDKLRLSRAFFRTNAFLVRSGFFLGGLLTLIAPEFIILVLGVKWIPMLTAFRMLLIFTLLNPIKITLSKLFIAVGKPEKNVYANVLQFAVLLICLYTLGFRWEIAGVALAVDIMVIIGIAVQFWQAREHVQFSIMRLLTSPTLALITSFIITYAVIQFQGVDGSLWRLAALKVFSFCTFYLGILILMEKDQLIQMGRYFINLLPQKSN